MLTRHTPSSYVILIALLALTACSSTPTPDMVVLEPALTNAPTESAPPTATAESAVATEPPAEEPLVVAETPTAAPASPAEPTPLQSQEGGAAMTLTFNNQSSQTIQTFWISLAGEELPYTTLSAGETFAQGTYEFHAWRIRDALSGALYLDLLADSNQPEVVITDAEIAGLLVTPSFSLNLPAPLAVQPSEDRSGCVVTVPPARFDQSDYGKYCDAGGIGIIATAAVDDLALQQAYYIIMNLLAPMPGVQAYMASEGAYFIILGRNEQQTDPPEYADLITSVEGKDFWDNRARGLGGGPGQPYTSGGEENLLCLASDRYLGEGIALHEMVHTLHLLGLNGLDPDFGRQLEAIYAQAMAEGLWFNTYAATNSSEYFAEAVQSYFNDNQIGPPNGDSVHNEINTRVELAEYDPRLFAFIETIYGGYDWTPTCP